MATAEDRRYIKLWQDYLQNNKKSTPIDINETPAQKKKRIERLEKNPEEWKKYYFPHYCTSESADFHKRFFKRVLKNGEWFEVISWARELAKTSTVMMVVMYVILVLKTKKKVLLVSNNLDNARRLLLPYKATLEANNRLINDYGEQVKLGSWEATEFVTKHGVSFRAIGAQQSPRGTRNDADRPDIILIDDIDTDEECRNAGRIKDKVKWINEALLPTRAISKDLLVLVCGNIIAKYCCVTEMAKKADHHDIVNIRDKHGKSTWKEKNTEEMIDRVLEMISWAAGQKEYFNNPISEGDIFEEITYGKCPPIHTCDTVLVYADPSTSNRDRAKGKKQASHKSVGIIGSKGRKIYLYKVWLQQTSNAKFVEWLYEAFFWLKEKKVDTFRIWIENNTLQNPHYEQVLLPLIYSVSKNKRVTIPITPDTRKKPEKFTRIEGTLEPLNRLGNLIFNTQEQEDPHMKRMDEQMLGVSETATVMDGPDMLEGGAWKIIDINVSKETEYAYEQRESRKY